MFNERTLLNEVVCTYGMQFLKESYHVILYVYSAVSIKKTKKRSGFQLFCSHEAEKLSGGLPLITQ